MTRSKVPVAAEYGMASAAAAANTITGIMKWRGIGRATAITLGRR